MLITFKAYNHSGFLCLSTWTATAGTYKMERAVYQTRLNRGDFSHVDLSSDDPTFQNERMYANNQAVNQHKGDRIMNDDQAQEMKILKDLDKAFKLVNATNKRTIKSMDQICVPYQKMRPYLDSVVFLIGMIPIWGVKVKTVMMFVLRIADAACVTVPTFGIQSQWRQHDSAPKEIEIVETIETA